MKPVVIIPKNLDNRLILGMLPTTQPWYARLWLRFRGLIGRPKFVWHDGECEDEVIHSSHAGVIWKRKPSAESKSYAPPP